MSRRGIRTGVVCLLIALAAVILFLPALRNGFVFDDTFYLVDNHHVREGLSLRSIGWAVTTFHYANWHPVTWLSHLTDMTLFGPFPRGHHLVNVLLHGINAGLLCLVLFRLTGALWPGAAAALLFAVHPLHVESVAWVSERKDVLSTLWGMLALLAYVAHVRKPGLGRYLATTALFGLGLLSKPMLVTFPFVLLLFDFWPLGRLLPAPNAPRERLLQPVLEKLPLLAMSAASSVVTYLAQKSGDALVTDVYPVWVRIQNALVSLVLYLWKMIRPAGLAFFYPHPGDTLPSWGVLGAAALLLCLTGAALALWRREPFLLTGWLFFLGTLVPVIGLVQVGGQAMADRYTYVPLTGVFIALAWGLSRLVRARRLPALLPFLAALLAFPVLALVTGRQIGTWSSETTLYRHALKVTKDNWMANNNLGVILYGQGKYEDAIRHYAEAIRINPNGLEARNNLGAALDRIGFENGALEQYRTVLSLDPTVPETHNNLGEILARKGQLDEAILHFREAVRLKPDYPEAHNNLGAALIRKGLSDEAILHFREALAATPVARARARFLMGELAFDRGGFAEAAEEYRKALRIIPDYPEALRKLSLTLRRLGDPAGARAQLEILRSVNPDLAAKTEAQMADRGQTRAGGAPP